MFSLHHSSESCQSLPTAPAAAQGNEGISKMLLEFSRLQSHPHMECVDQAQGTEQVCLGPFQLRLFCDSVPLRIYQHGYFTWKFLAAPISSPGLSSFPFLMDKSSQLDLVFHDQGKKRSRSQLWLRFYVDFLFLPFLHCSITCQDKEIVTEPV